MFKIDKKETFVLVISLLLWGLSCVVSPTPQSTEAIGTDSPSNVAAGNGGGLNGEIWTTTASAEPQDVNLFLKGETVYVHGEGFDPDLDLTLVIFKVNQPNKDWLPILLLGHIDTGSGGSFLVGTWAIPGDLDSNYEGEYKVEVECQDHKKSDNFRISSFVIPELPLGTIGTMAVMLAGLIIFLAGKSQVARTKGSGIT